EWCAVALALNTVFEIRPFLEHTQIAADSKKTGGSGSTDFRDEPPSRQPPVPGDRSLRNIQHCRRLLHAQSAKVTKLDDFRLAWVRIFQFVERVVQNQEIAVFADTQVGNVAELDAAEAAAVLGGCAFAGRVHQYPSHDLGAHRKEVSFAVSRDILPVDQAQVDFVNQVGGLQSLSFALALHERPRHAAQFAVHARSQGF